MSNVILKCSGIEKSYRLEKINIPVLKGIDMEVEKGSWTALLGASGSGKSTLLNLLGAFEKPDAGEICYENTPYSGMKRNDLVVFRRRKVGFIFQSFYLLPELNIRENVELPGRLTAAPRAEIRERALALLDQVGLGHRINHRPNELSGGEQQRAAIARALINRPDMILADEPTGNLDSKTGDGILDIFQELRRHSGEVTIIMVTHDQHVASLADNIIELKDGVVMHNE
jgi:ABC-type lipoprotein export system ATPase subunit